MEDSKAMVLSVAVAVLLIVVSKLRSWVVTKHKSSKLNLPPGPWTLPLIGSIHHLVVRSPIVQRGLRDLSRKYGPLMMLRLGEVSTLVVSSPEAAEAITKTHDIAFADRHVNATLGALTFDATDIIFGSYDDRWRQLRKICVLELLSVARVRSFQRIREEEVARFLANLAAAASASGGGGGATTTTTTTVNLSKMLSRLINDTIVRESIGSRCEQQQQEEYLDAFDTALRLTTTLTVADLFPSSRLMQALGTAPRKALACRNRIERILDVIVRDKRDAMDRGDKTAQDGMLGVLLRLQKEATLPIELTNDIIVTLMFDMFGAGSDTSATTLTWCMAELVRSPAAMSRAQAEVREAFKGKQQGESITEDDLATVELSYLKNVIKETLRLHCPVPLLVPRRCRETVQVMGYDIPKGTSVFVNVWSICRDPMYWDDAEEFKPERFEEKSMDYKGTSYEFLPFGSGRRMCPGSNLGLANMELALASLLYHFDWKLPSGMEPKDVDMQEAAGLVAKKNKGLFLQPIIRFAPARA